MQTRKRIALLLGQAEENYQKLFIEGFFKQAFTYNYDVCVFAMYQKYQETTAREIGESTIFSLVNYELFDAVVILLDTLQTPGVAELVEDKIKQCFDGPVLCVDKESKYFSTLMTDHYSVAKKVISHLIEVHGYEDIAYLTGKKWHLHSKERLRAYKDAMREHNLSIKENRIFYGDFWYSSGETMVEKLLKDRDNMPRAIACANDCMAIGVAGALEANGLRIPEDVAVVGYDSVEEGRTSPKPLTSAPIPARECGVHAALSIHAMLANEPIPEFTADVDLFIGSSCGCHNDSVIPKVELRESWETDISGGGFYSCYNHMMEDMLSKSNFHDLMNTIFTYVYQIGEFESFTICLNSQWKDLKRLTEKDGNWRGYTKQMLPILQCVQDNNAHNPLNYETTFDKDDLLPILFEERENPTAFFFTPMHFEERCLGYAVISYGNAIRSYDDTYRLWLRSAMQGLECFRRIEALQQSNTLLQASQVRDSLTGLYNYQGVLQRLDRFYGHYISAIAIDIKGLAHINEKYGREEGNRAINAVAHVLNNCITGGVSCRLGNGEFVGVIISENDDKKHIQSIKNLLLQQLDSLDGFLYDLSVYIGCDVAQVYKVEDFEHLINSAVGQKNGNKINERKLQNTATLTQDEQKEAAVVSDILDENRFHYHFQPIVNAKNGEIYAYEALMRADVTPYLSPIKILKYAEYLERLYDVEKSTFFNVLECVGNEEAVLAGRKVFINSIPGNHLHGEDAKILEDKMQDYAGAVVVELTEQTEISDDELVTMKENYAKMGIETAVDDYGTGYSNVTNLLRYMPNYVKIDRMLLSKIQESPQKQHFVREIVEFAHDNDIKALAEGVETTEELEMVIHLGVDLIQGYYTAKPAKDIITSIDERVKDEILRYQQQEMANKGRKVYVAGKEGRISLAKLVADKYASIEVVSEKTTYRDITIAGVPGVSTNLCLDVKDGYQGRIILENISFSAKKRKSCIQIGKSCEVTLVLKGENHLVDGGICVPEGSKLVIEGDGDLSINIGRDDYFGIGNDLESIHGTIIFEQDGCVEIYGSGYRGIGIGSGKGGILDIKRGKYVVELIGEEGVGIGTYQGDLNLQIAMCSISLNLVTTNNVGIGSYDGDVNVAISHIMLKGIFGGTESVGIGSLRGRKTRLDIANSNVNLNMRAIKICALGLGEKESFVVLEEAGVHIKAEGRNAIAIGNYDCTGKVQMINADVDIRLKSDMQMDIGAQESDIMISNGRCQFFLNGQEIERITQDGEL